MNTSTYTLALHPKYPHSPRARIIVTLEDCQLADVDDPVELLRWAAEFLTGKEWPEVTLDDGGELLRMIQNQEQSWRWLKKPRRRNA